VVKRRANRSTLGIIGGGQLALYLCEAARGLGIEVAVLADSADDPALHRADLPFAFDSADAGQLALFLDACDVVTFDKEAVADDVLARLVLQSEHEGLRIRPGVATLSLLKDKARQKAWLRDQDLPTLPFLVIEARPDSVLPLTDALGSALVQKRRSGGYDGRGVQILQKLESPGQLWDAPSLLEPLLPDCREVSVVTARARSGEIQTYPPVSMEFDARLNAVRTVSMPAAISPALTADAIALAERAVTLLQGIGVFAIEMFVSAQGQLLINEISPRVHNSGHLTQEACNVSQFEQHVRAVMGLPLAAITQTLPAAMCNILYAPGMQSRCPQRAVTHRLPGERAAVYWYGKAPGSPGRKMGHINAVASNVGEAIATAQQVLADVTGEQQEDVA
jgi:5-(carboxyamino)imidazole ribonucleotide synthase